MNTKTTLLSLSIAALLGSTQAQAFSFDDGAIASEENAKNHMNQVVEPAPKSNAGAETERQKLKQKMAEAARQREVNEQQKERQAEMKRQELKDKMAQAARQREMEKREKERQAELERQKLKQKMEQAERERKAEEARKKREEARAKAIAEQKAEQDRQRKIEEKLNEARRVIPTLDMTAMSDRYTFKDLQAEMKDLAGTESMKTQIVLELGAKEYVRDAQKEINAVVKRIQDAGSNGKPDAYKKAAEDFPEVLDLAQEMLNLSNKYRDNYRWQMEFQNTIDDWKKRVPEVQENAKNLASGGSADSFGKSSSMVSTPIGEIDINKAVNGAVGVGKEVGGKALDVTKKGFGVVKGFFGG